MNGFSIICPVCKTSISFKNADPVIEKGFICPSCNFKTESEAASVGLLVESFLRNGRKIEAIKIYKAHTKKGLKESKEDVELIAQRLGIELKKGCFIATACYGSPDAENVKIFRKYRDEVLMKNRLGTAVMEFYYFVSPSLANQIEKSEVVKKLLRKGFLSPLARQLKK